MKMIILNLVILTSIFGCASRNYKATDYAYACVANGNEDLKTKSSHLCLPIDTYENKMQYHSMRPSEMRKMKTLDDVMD
jgi:hypothetical protein